MLSPGLAPQVHFEKGVVSTLAHALQIAESVGNEEVQRIVDDAGTSMQ